MKNFEPLKLHEFYKKYANTPLNDRFIVLDFNKGGLKTLRSIFEELQTIDDAVRPLTIRKDKLLELAKEGFKNLTNTLKD